MQLSEQARHNRDGWQTLSTELHFKNAHLSVASEEVRSSAHQRAISWTIVRRKCAVIIAPITTDGKLVLIRQERIPIRTEIWEVPAGQVDDSVRNDGDELAAAALRELRKETGYELAPDGELQSLRDFFPSPGFTDERGYFFLARPVVISAAGPAHDESESILECRSFSAPELTAMIARNEIRNENTLSICAKLAARGLLSLGSS